MLVGTAAPLREEGSTDSVLLESSIILIGGRLIFFMSRGDILFASKSVYSSKGFSGSIIVKFAKNSS